ncbi:EthD family reductase [Burkholderia plantarii]|uniref:EthD family reductase n=1 Tax=Burkholderia plantarii TaxID=41899 RepID=UPI0008709BFD|nr:EthD family reductase [Burkholderia plantarii]
MLTRCAFFSGRVRPGFEARFDEHVRTRLVPLRTRLPGARDVRVPRRQHGDAGEPAFALVISMRFADQAAIDAALDSPVRRESQAESRAPIEMVDGVAFHTVFAATV